MKQHITNILLFLLVVAIFWNGAARPPRDAATKNAENGSVVGVGSVLDETVLVKTELPVRWGDIGQKIVASGAIDLEKLQALYGGRGGIAPEDLALLTESPEKILLTRDNAGYLLNVFWALGLANKNRILEEGEMQNYGDVSRFASTGGWTLARVMAASGAGSAAGTGSAGAAMGHYSMHPWITLTKEQQELLERVANGVYRPCCGNSTHFPDCNHGMAMLGFLELMASQGRTEEEMYRAALALNKAWFPDTYETIDRYLALRGGALATADPKVVLGADYSGAAGYRRILQEVQTPSGSSGGGGCGV